VIGNGSYSKAIRLESPLKDARAVSDILQKLNYDVIQDFLVRAEQHILDALEPVAWNCFWILASKDASRISTVMLGADNSVRAASENEPSVAPLGRARVRVPTRSKSPKLPPFAQHLNLDSNPLRS